MPVAVAADGTEIHYEVRGNVDGPSLLLGPPFTASPNEAFAAAGVADPTDPWVVGLGTDFRLVLADLPRGTGGTGNALGKGNSADAVVADYVAVLDASRTEQAAWIGYSFGGAIGMQMARRTDRLSAVVIGGWPPLNQPFEKMLGATTSMAEAAPPGTDPDTLWSSVGFYAGLVGWPERTEVPQISVPRLVFMGTEDVVDYLGPEHVTPLRDMLRAVEPELSRLGWDVVWIEGRGHLEAIAADAALAAVRDFLRQKG